MLLIGQQGLGDLPPIWLEDCANFTTLPEENDQYSANPSECNKQQANTLLSMNNYTPLVISCNDKNKQVTLLSQCKLALTAGNIRFAL